MAYSEGNIADLSEYVRTNIPEAEPIVQKTTYFMMLDCRGLGLGTEKLDRRIEGVARVALDHGHWFGEAAAGLKRALA